MTGYGQFCPVAKGAEVFAERWMPLVLRELLCGSTRFNDLHRGVPLMSRSLLSRKLRRPEEVGVVERKLAPSGREYHLTEAGREFAPDHAEPGRLGPTVVPLLFQPRRARRRRAVVGHAPGGEARRLSGAANLR